MKFVLARVGDRSLRSPEIQAIAPPSTSSKGLIYEYNNIDLDYFSIMQDCILSLFFKRQFWFLHFNVT